MTKTTKIAILAGIAIIAAADARSILQLKAEAEAKMPSPAILDAAVGK